MMSGPCAVWVMTTSAERIDRQPAYLLHHRAYRETSALVDLLTPNYGRVRGVLKGVRQPRSRKRELLRAFQPLTISWQGQGELKTIQDGEASGLTHPLSGRALWCGLYLNELLVRLLPQDQPCPRLYALYRFSLEGLSDPDTEEAVLRIFERRLLEELGVAFPLDHDVTGSAIDPQRHYNFDPIAGFELVENDVSVGRHNYLGATIHALAADDYSLSDTRRAAKQLMRTTLALQ